MKYEVWSMKYEVWSMKYEVWSMKYEVWVDWEKLEYLYRKMFGSKLAWANRKESDRLGAVQSTEAGCGGCDGEGLVSGWGQTIAY